MASRADPRTNGPLAGCKPEERLQNWGSLVSSHHPYRPRKNGSANAAICRTSPTVFIGRERVSRYLQQRKQSDSGSGTECSHTSVWSVSSLRFWISLAFRQAA
jgi:hypothetical protein